MRHRAPALPGPAEPGSVVAELRDVEVRFGSRSVVVGVDLRVRAGELLALVGPNGAGKSTLLAVAAGDIAPHRGEALLAGRPIGSWPAVQVARRRAVLPQQVTLSFPFRVADVVRMGRAPWAGTPLADDDDAAVDEAMARTGVAELADRPFLSLSGGERARAALARVLAQRTGLLLLDEPTAALDLRHQELVLRLARANADAGGAVVAVLHDLGLAGAHADRIALLDRGRIVEDGAPSRVLRPELLSPVYGHDVEVLTHPRTGVPLVLPVRDAPARRPLPTGAAGW